MNIRKIAIAGAAIALTATTIPIPAQAAAGPPSEATMLRLLLTVPEMKAAVKYGGDLELMQDPSCGFSAEENFRDCGVSTKVPKLTAITPRLAWITGTASVAAARAYFTKNVIGMQPWDGVAFTVVKKTAKEFTIVVTPTTSPMPPLAMTHLVLKAGIVGAQCEGPDGATAAQLSACSLKLAKAQAKKVTSAKPRTPLG